MSPQAASAPIGRRPGRVDGGEARPRREHQRDQHGVQRPRLRVVDDSNLRLAARRKRVRFLGVVAAVVVVASLFGLAAFQAVLVQGQVRVDTLANQMAEEQAHYQQLRREVAELESPQRVVDEAVGRLGMVKPDRVEYLTPPEGATSIGDRHPSVSDDTSHGERPWASVKPFLGAGS